MLHRITLARMTYLQQAPTISRKCVKAQLKPNCQVSAEPLHEPRAALESRTPDLFITSELLYQLS